MRKSRSVSLVLIGSSIAMSGCSLSGCSPAAAPARVGAAGGAASGAVAAEKKPCFNDKGEEVPCPDPPAGTQSANHGHSNYYRSGGNYWGRSLFSGWGSSPAPSGHSPAQTGFHAAPSSGTHTSGGTHAAGGTHSSSHSGGSVSHSGGFGHTSHSVAS